MIVFSFIRSITMSTTPSNVCIICMSNCNFSTFHDTQTGHAYRVECLRCGTYYISHNAFGALSGALGMDDMAIKAYSNERYQFDDPRTLLFRLVAKRGTYTSRSIISHVLRKSNIERTLRSSDLSNLLHNNHLPSPAETANNLIIYLGDNLYSPGDTIKVPAVSEIKDSRSLYGTLGLYIGNEAQDLNFLITSLGQQNLLKVINQKGSGGRETTIGHQPIPEQISLTLSGWERFEEIKRSVKDSRKAFIAMQFIDPKKEETEDYFFQKHLFREYLVPAAKMTGYDLANPLASNPKAGNIHARLEVEIRSSRFVVAELSHHNNGAYWEAGFARGLGKPVIYMYNREIGGSERPHFDVGSDQIIFWEKDKPEDAAEQLKNIIRATLFGEAKQEDG